MKPKSLTQNRTCAHSSKRILQSDSNEFVHNGELIQNIDDAKNWLEKAKDEFIGANAVRGELNLSLAQAEVQRARELSREQCVSTLQDLPHAAGAFPPTRGKNSFFLPLAAGFGILMLCAGSLVWFHWHSEMPIQPKQPVARMTQPGGARSESVNPVPAQPTPFENDVAKTAPLIHEKSAPRVGVLSPQVDLTTHRQVSTEQKPIVAEQPVVEQTRETVKTESPVVKETPSVAETVVAEAPPIAKNAPEVQEISSARAIENPRRNPAVPQVEPAAAVNSGRVQTALQLPEDDLANIAKHSLKSGR